MAGRKGSFSKGSQDAQQFGKSVDSLADSLTKLSQKGGNAAGAINTISNAAGKVNPLLGALGSVIGLVVAQGEKLKQLELDEAIAGIGVSSSQVSVEWERFTGGLVAAGGETGVMREKLMKLADTQISLRLIGARVNAEIERQTELVKAGTITEEQATSRIRDYVEVEKQRFTAATNTRIAIEKEISALKTRNKEIEKKPTRFEQAMHISEIRQEVRNEQLEEEERLQRELTVARYDAQQAMIVLNEQQKAERLKAYNDEIERQDRLWKDFGQGVALSAATNALNAYYDALDKTVSLNAIFAGSFDRAMRNAAASTVRAVGQEAAVRAIFELADGWRYLGTPGMQGLAAFHFKSAALFGAIAVGAGPAAGLLSVAPGGGSGGGGGGRGGGGGGTGGPGGGRSGPIIHVTVIGAPDFSTKRSIAEWVREVEDEGG